MNFRNRMNIYDKALLILFISLFSGNMGGILLLPRTFSILLFPLLNKSRLLTTWQMSTKTPRVLLLVWVIWGAISLVWTPDISQGGENFVMLLFNILFAYEILFFSSRSNNPLFFIAFGWLIALSINNCIGIWEILTDNHLSVSKFGSDREMMVEGVYVFMRYANGFFSNYNAFVTFICCSLPFMYYLVFSTQNKTLKLFVLVNLIAAICILFMDASRGGIISLAIISLVFFFSLFRQKKSVTKNIILFLIIFCFVAWNWDTLSALIIGRQNNTTSVEDEARFIIWINCLNLLADTGGIGTGVGGIDASMAAYAGFGGTLAPHNAFFEILIQYGIVIFILFIYFLISLYLFARRNKQMFPQVVVYSSLFAMPFIFLINSLYLKNPFFWAFLMSLFIYSNIKPRSEISKKNGSRCLR